MLISSGAASGQSYPNRPIRIVCGQAGGGNDFVARILALGISGPMGQQVIVDNRLGTILPMEVVSKASPDGYSLLIAGPSFLTFPLFRKAPPYDPVNDFSPVVLLTKEIKIFAVHPSVAAKSVKEVIALAKAKPGELNYGTSGAGGATHLAGEYFKSMAGINIVHIPYKGNVPTITALMSGEVQMMFMDPGLVMPHVKDGRMRALAVTSAEPSALAPGLPTVSASGLPGYEWVGLSGIWAPAKTPSAVINRVNQEIVRLLARADIKEKFLNAGIEPGGSSPEQLGATVKSETAKLAKLIKDAGLKLE